MTANSNSNLLSGHIHTLGAQVARLGAAMSHCVTYPFETGNAAETVTVPPSLHMATCPALGGRRPNLFFTTAAEGRAWLAEVYADDPRPVDCPVCLGQDHELEELLSAARDAGPSERIHYRDLLARRGERALDALGPWLQDGRLGAFTVRVLEKAYPESPSRVVSMLNEAIASAPTMVAEDAREALGRLGRRALSWPHLAPDSRTVAFVGDGPLTVEELRVSQPAPHLDRTEALGSFIDTFVVGRDATDTTILIEYTLQRPRPARFLPQEAWVGLLLSGTDWWLDAPDRLNRLVDHHPALSVVRSSWPNAIRWPNSSPSGVGPAGPEGPLNADSFLHRRGYSVAAAGPPRSRRWQILESAVEEFGVLPVASHIAFLARMAKLRSDTTMVNAIAEWDHDLSALKAAFYIPGTDVYLWPSSDP